MSKIINFPVKKQNSNGYYNLVALFKICDNVESCNFYLDAAEHLFENDHITEKELFTIRRIGRRKRIELATPIQGAPAAVEPGTYLYTPEMGQQKPSGCEITAGRCYYGGHYWLKTRLELKGRGIVKNESLPDGFINYTVTERVFEKLKKEYRISYECSLD